jgi:L-fuconolactonase
MKIDSHQHFWEYDPHQYPWIKPDWPIRKSFLPQDLKPLLDKTGFDACIAVQARQTIAETKWLLQLSDQHPFIAGVVGWVDLQAEAPERQLDHLLHPKLVGVRHVAQDEPDDRFLVRKEVLRGISILAGLQLAYDILIFPKQLPAAIELARKFPNQRFILDHIAKPFIRDGTLEPWAAQIRELAKSPNVACKLSGMVTEARWFQWRPDDFRPYLDTIWEAFGEDRLMIGSDWPVCLLSADYSLTMGMVQNYIDQFSEPGRQKVLGTNASRFYHLAGRECLMNSRPDSSKTALHDPSV